MRERSPVLFIHCSRALIASACLLAFPCQAQQDNSDSGQTVPSHHRLDFGLIYLDSSAEDSINVELSYAYNFSSDSNISATISYLDTSVDKKGGEGFGDTALNFSWSPFTPLSVGPWVPKKIGTGVTVVLPTGDEKKGLGTGTTIIMPSLGFAYGLTDTFYLFPALVYGRSMDHIANGKDFDVGWIDLGAGWTLADRYWIRLYAAWIKDFEADDTHLNTALSLGVLFSERWSASFDYSNTDFFIPGTVPAPGLEPDDQYSFNLHYNF